MKKNTILLIDFDSTFVTVESLDELAKIALRDRVDMQEVLEKIKAITALGMEGKITFPDSLMQRLKLFKPDKKHLEELILLLHTAITPSFKRNKTFLKKNAERIYIVSGGFKEYMVPVLKEYGIIEDHILGNTFLFDSAGNVIGYDKNNPLAQEKGKVKTVRQMKFKNPIIMIGDGYTDYEVKEAGLAKIFIAFTENITRDVLANKADGMVKDFDQVIKKL